MKKSFPVIFPVFFAVLVSNALSYAASSPIPCEKAHELPPISDNDMGFIRGIVSGLKDVLDDVSCPKLYCKKYLAWEQKNYFRLPACSGFYVDPKGKVGPLTDTVAKLVAQDIETYGNKSPFMQNYSQFEAVCKNFDLMNASEKVGFYAWFFENLAFHETTCSPIPENTAANVPNGPAVGLYQLEYDPRGPLMARPRLRRFASRDPHRRRKHAMRVRDLPKPARQSSRSFRVGERQRAADANGLLAIDQSDARSQAHEEASPSASGSLS